MARIRRDGATAVLELRQTADRPPGRSIVDGPRTGWQAVDLIDGHLTR